MIFLRRGKGRVIPAAVLALGALLSGGEARAAPSFTLEPGAASVLAPAKVHHVERNPGAYRLFYSAAPDFIQSVTSADGGYTWTSEAGQRLSIQAGSPDAGGITAFGMTGKGADGFYKAYYVGISSTGLYSILRATSTDQVAWVKTAGFNIRFGGGGAFVDSVHPFISGSSIQLYYIRDSAGGNTPANYRAYRMASADDGLTFSGETGVSGAVAYGLSVSTLTSGVMRLYLISPIGGGTAMQVLSFTGADGPVLSQESGVRFSTAAALSSISVVKSTDGYRWLSFLTIPAPGTGTQHIYRALTRDPSIDGISPSMIYVHTVSGVSLATFTVSGEVFAPAVSSVTLRQGASAATVTSCVRDSDLQLRIVADFLNSPPGWYSLTVTNPDGQSSTLANAVKLDYRPGAVALLDNLFRPLNGQTVKVTVNIPFSGNITARIYDLNGGRVRALYNGPAVMGDNNYAWDGKTDAGAVAASGLYLLRVKGPRVDAREKIVLIK